MADSSLSDKLAALSPEQLAMVQARLNQRTPSASALSAGALSASTLSSVKPREQVSDIPERACISVDGEKAWRATSTQARLWFLEQYLGPNPVYNIVRSLRLSGPLNSDALEKSLKHIVQRHEALRTTFHNVEGIPYQVVNHSNDFELNVLDLKGMPAAEREAKFQHQLRYWGQQPFDLTKDCLLRVILFQLDTEDCGLLFVLHHIVGDGWSLNLFADELSKLYQAFATDQPNPLSPVDLQFADYSLWLERQLLSTQQQEKVRYWQKQLSGTLPVLELPYDYPRGSEQTYQGARVPISINPKTVQALKQLGSEVGASLFMVLLASFKVLLHRYSGQTDIIVGSPFANRSSPEIENVMGYFVDNLPLRTDVSGNPSFLSLLKRVQKTSVEAYTHAYPFAEILNTIQTTADNSHSPVFSVMMVLQNMPTNNLELPNIRLKSCFPDGLPPQTKAPLSSYRFSQDIQVARFDLTILIKEEQGELTGVLEYNQELFNPDTIERLINHWHQLIQGILANPHGHIHQLPILSATERHQLLVEWNATQTAYPRDKCIHQLFEEQVTRSPDAVAVVFKDESLTYQELNARANQLAHRLQSLGVKPNSLVGLCIDRSLEMVIGILAILKAGGAYVPLDPSYPSERLAFMVQDTQIKVLLTTQPLKQTCDLKYSISHIICLDQEFLDKGLSTLNSEANTHLPTPEPPAQCSATDLAYVMYTSGSTGQPKGVSVRHRGVVRLVKDTNYAMMTAEDVFLQLAPIAFDAATLEIWGALLNGAKLVLFSEPSPTPEKIVQVVSEHNVTFLWLTAGLFHLMIDHGLEGLSSLRHLLAGGDVLSVSHVRRAAEQLENCAIINGYGPTENTTFTCCHTISKEISAKQTLLQQSIPIGRPIANTQVYVLDPQQQLVPIGVAGELYIGGDGLAQEYFNRPDLTQERFIPNPFGTDLSGTDTSEKLYRTGDLVRCQSDGTLEFLGRLDNQVKIRGFRIELSEIETALVQHPQVKDVVVVVREEQPGDKRLVAYLTADDMAENGVALSVSELRRYLHDKLPAYMVPSAFVVLEALPLTPNGKIDRRALPAPDPSQRTLDTAFISPQTSIEKQLAQVWCNLLKLEKVGIHDNFFELGGHSLVAVQLVAEVHRVFKVELSLPVLFKSPTIGALSAFIEATQQNDQPASVANSHDWPYLVPLQTGGSKQPIFLIPGGGINEDALIRLTKFTYHLGAERPTYGLRVTQFLEGNSVIFKSAEAMASAFINEIRTLQPEGPYQLVGECLGGVIAFEMAQQLKQQGEKVTHLVLLDTVVPTQSKRQKFQQRRKISALLFKVFREVSDLPTRQKLPYLLRTFKKVVALSVYSEITDRDAREYHALITHMGNALNYNPSYYSGEMTLLVSEDSKFEQPDLGWQSFSPDNLTIHLVPGNHDSYLEEYAKDAAQALSQCLDRNS